MGITDELRKWGYGFCGDTHDVVTAIADRIDAEHERELAEQQDSLTVGMQPMTEENMAEGGWVRGPLDADGKMWRRGDMSDSNWGVIEGIAYVLQKLLGQAVGYSDAHTTVALNAIAEFAAKLRLAEGVDK